MLRFPVRVAIGASVLTGLLASCTDSIPTAIVPQDLPNLAAAAGSSGTACASSADYVVSSRAALTAALAAAGAGQTIAIDGVIQVTGTVMIQGNGIRLTCATPGSGLITQNFTGTGALLQVAGDDVQVDNLFLSSVPANGVGGSSNTVLAFRPASSPSTVSAVERFRLNNNQMRCGRDGSCAFLIGTPDALVSDNHMQSIGTTSAIHVQEIVAIRTDNTAVERNEITAPVASGSPLFGAIRVRGGRGLVVRQNSISGAWRNGIALSELDDALIQNNYIRDARDHGILASTNPVARASVRNSIIRANKIHGPQAIGINLSRACWNRVEGNDVPPAPGTLRARFEVTTGANAYAGNPANVVDQGSFDCDADGETDPNRVAGSSGASPSQASAARIETGSSSTHRSVLHSGEVIPERQ